MRTSVPGRLAVAATGFALLLGTAACSDPAADAKAAADKRAAAEKQKADDKLLRKLTHQVECLAALRWQRPALSSAGIGNVTLYDDHFTKALEADLGDRSFPAEDGKPELSKAGLTAYLDTVYPDLVKTRFTSGRDYDKDGTVTGSERSNPGFNLVTACVQEAAEAGTGPLAGKDKVLRMFQIKELRGKLKDKDG